MHQSVTLSVFPSFLYVLHWAHEKIKSTTNLKALVTSIVLYGSIADWTRKCRELGRRGRDREMEEKTRRSILSAQSPSSLSKLKPARTERASVKNSSGFACVRACMYWSKPWLACWMQAFLDESGWAGTDGRAGQVSERAASIVFAPLILSVDVVEMDWCLRKFRLNYLPVHLC